jgi:hypothetical protein
MTASAKRAPYSEVGKPAELRRYRVVRGAGAYVNATSACWVARSTACSSVCAEGHNSFHRSPCLLNLLKIVLISAGVTREDREFLAFLRDVLNVLGLPDPPNSACGFRGSAQHLRAVYWQESESPKFFAGVDSDAARSCPVGIVCSRIGRFSLASIVAAGGWCFRWFLVARGCADH